MDYLKLKDTDLTVSRLALGCEPLGGTDWGAVDERELRRVVETAYDLGINLFDTAAVYGLGRSEEFLASALGNRRKHVILSTKVGLSWPPPRNGERAVVRPDGSPVNITEAVDGCLARLRVDCIPLLYIHSPDPCVPIESTMDALIKCKEAGKIRFIGCSNFNSTQLKDAAKCHSIAALQIEYNMLNASTSEEILNAKAIGETNVIVYGALVRGLLGGRYDINTKFSPDDRRSRLRSFQGESFRRNLERLSDVQAIATEYNCSTSQIAISWVLKNPLVASVIVGAKKADQVFSNANALGVRLTDEDYISLTNIGKNAI